MKLNTLNLKKQILQILNEDGISPEELANKSGISAMTVYRILNESGETTQRAIGRKIAEGTGRRFRIAGDQIEFYKEPINQSPDALKQEIIEIYDSLSQEERIRMKKTVEAIWGNATIGTRKEENS